jgi:hypothetical protein
MWLVVGAKLKQQGWVGCRNISEPTKGAPMAQSVFVMFDRLCKQKKIMGVLRVNPKKQA